MIGKILCCGDGTHNGEDIESQCDGTQENNEPNKDAQGFQVNTLSTMSPNLLSSLLCLCGTVYNTSSVIDLRPQLDASSFLNNLRNMVVKRSGPTVENLSVCKAAGNMVISMLKY